MKRFSAFRESCNKPLAEKAGHTTLHYNCAVLHFTLLTTFCQEEIRLFSEQIQTFYNIRHNPALLALIGAEFVQF